MKKFFIVLIILVMGGATASAQTYKQAVGLRLGYTQGIEYKDFVSPDNFISAGMQLHAIGRFGVNGYLFYDFNRPLGGSEFVSWYFGPGATLGYGGHMGGFNFSLNAQVGVEFVLKNAPVAFSVDWAPGVGFGFWEGGHNIGFSPTFGGLGIKYLF